MYWKCPNCKSKVDFEDQMKEVFENGEADFEPVKGLFMHTIVCDICDADWIVSISKMNKPEEWLNKNNDEELLF